MNLLMQIFIFGNILIPNNQYIQEININDNLTEIQFKEDTQAKLTLKYNNKSIENINQKKLTLSEPINTNLEVYENHNLIFYLSYLEFLFDENPDLEINSFSFNSNHDHINIKNTSSKIGILNLDQLKILYNDTEIDKTFEIEGNYLQKENYIIFDKELNLTLSKNFKQESKIEIFYKDKKIDSICNLKDQNCNFSNLIKDLIYKKIFNRWEIYNQQNKIDQEQPLIEIDQENQKIQISVKSQQDQYTYKIINLEIDNQTQIENQIDINLNFDQIVLNLIDNLGNQSKINLTSTIKAEQNKYQEVQSYQQEIQTLNQNITNLKSNFLNQPDTNQTDNSKQDQISEENTQEILETPIQNPIPCNNKLKILKINPQNSENQEYIILKNQLNSKLELNNCKIIDHKQNQISLPSTINPNQELQIFSKNILNNDQDQIFLIDTLSNQQIDECTYKINKFNQYQEIICNLEITPEKNLSTPEVELISDTLNTQDLSETLYTQESSNINYIHENSILITEINANPIGTDKNNEWIEIYNPGQDFNGKISIKINDEIEIFNINIKKQAYQILNPKKALTNSNLKIELNNQVITIKNSKENESYALINQAFEPTKFITLGESNPSKETLECKIQEINLNTNEFTCNQMLFLNQNPINIKINQDIEVKYLKTKDQNIVLEIINTKENFINLKNTSFTILSILSLIFMHKISF